MVLKSNISYLKIIEKGDTVGYNQNFIAEKKTNVATIPFGFADGLLTLETGEPYVIVNGQKAKIIGICMDNMMLYHVPDLELALSEVRRVLRPEGTFYAATYGEKNIMPFVHELLREYIKAPKFNRNFMLENGWEPLRRHFNDVRLNKYSDKLLITNMNDLADYVQSLTGTSQISGVSRETMIKVFTDNCADGVLTIPKEYGMFIGRA